MFPSPRGFKASQYIFFEMLPAFILGLAVFLSIILMFQVLRLTEFALVHGVSIMSILELIGYVCVSMLPVLFPMSLLFAVILTYGRLSADSEIVAMKACGLPMTSLLAPALVLGMLVAVLSGRTTFDLAPWGNRQFEVLLTRFANTKAAAAIKPGTFAEGFFDMVVYAKEVDSDQGLLKGVFIYDEKQGDTPLTIIAKSGRIIPDPDMPGHRVLLRLSEGDIHRKGTNHTKIKFDTYDLKLIDPVKDDKKEKSPPSLTLSDLEERLKQPELKDNERRTLLTEWHKRWAIAVLCPVFAMIGVGLGTTTNRRQQKSGGMILCVLLIIVYWILYLSFEGFARSGALPVALAIWFPNAVFASIAAWTLKKNWN